MSSSKTRDRRRSAERRLAARAARASGLPGPVICEHCGAFTIAGPLFVHIEAVRTQVPAGAGGEELLRRFLRLRTHFRQDEYLAVCPSCWCVLSLESGRHLVGVL